MEKKKKIIFVNGGWVVLEWIECNHIWIADLVTDNFQRAVTRLHKK